MRGPNWGSLMPKRRNNAKRHLELKRRVWWFKIGIPADARDYFGGRTHSLSQ